jgi:large subunit ribosomal protein L25
MESVSVTSSDAGTTLGLTFLMNSATIFTMPAGGCNRRAQEIETRKLCEPSEEHDRRCGKGMDQVDKITVEANKRDLLGKKVKQLRREGMIPAVLYGHNIKPISLKIEARSLSSALKAAGGSRLMEMQLGKDGPHTVLAREIQHDVITQEILHVDFHEVVMTEKITAEIPLTLIGESPAVRQGEGMLFTGLSSITMECLPGDLPEEIEVDLSGLMEIGQSIFVSDLRLADEVKVLSDSDDLIAKVLPLGQEEIIEEEIAEPEMIGEEEVEAEGEADAGEKEPDEG